MKRISTLLAATAFSAPALAADVIYEEPMMSPAPMVEMAAPPMWTGLYIGLQAGGAFNPDEPGDLSINPNFGGAGAAFLGTAFGNNFDSSFDGGFVGGAHAGYDFQFDRVVVGGVIDINATDISARQSAFSNTPAFYTAERDLDYLATARLRAGYLVTPSALAYATGGFAYGEVDYSFSTDSPAVAGVNPAAIVSEDEDEWGYSVGGGMEVKITDNLSFGAEYLYTNLGDGDSSTRLAGGPFDGSGTSVVPGQFTDFESDEDFDFHTVTAKLSYRFN